MGDTTIRYDRLQWVDFTQPYSDTGISMMVSANQRPNNSIGIKVKSLIKGVIYATFGLCLVSAFIFWFAEFCNDKNRRTHALLGSNPSGQHSNNDEHWRSK